MKIILLKDVPKVGRKYDTKEVSEGYAVNLLIPRGLAVAATSSAIKAMNVEKAKIDGERKIHEELLVKTLNDLDGKTITLTEKVNEKGHLFAGLHKPEVLKAIKDQTRLELNDEHLVLDKPIKEAGEHALTIQGAGKKVTLKLVIEAKK
jgi:large subunit ribosomal protein L9